MSRPLLILCFILSCQSSPIFCQPFFGDADIVEEYRETKNGITLVTSIGLHDSAEHQILDAFLRRLSKKLIRPGQTKIMIIVDWKLLAPWNAVIGYDTLRFDLHFIDEPKRRKKNSVQEVIIGQNAPIDSNYKPAKEIAIDWSGSHDRSRKDLGLKILYNWPLSDSNVIFFDRIYSLCKYGIEHLDEIKREQKRIEIRYHWEWLISVLTIDTSKVKKTPLKSLGFDPNNLNVESKSKGLVWIGSAILFVLISFFVFKMRRG